MYEDGCKRHSIIDSPIAHKEVKAVIIINYDAIGRINASSNNEFHRIIISADLLLQMLRGAGNKPLKDAARHWQQSHRLGPAYCINPRNLILSL